jgi:hypothetical protein
MVASLRASLAGSIDMLDLAEQLKLDANEITALGNAIHAANLLGGLPLDDAIARAGAAAQRTLAITNTLAPRRPRNARG